jgi:hypothetical protein
MGLDWQKSKSHLLLLQMYLHANNFENFARHEYWKTNWDNVLGEPATQSIKRFIDEGMLMTATDLNDLISYKYKVTELKDLLKQRGLPVSGHKEEMIKRLIQADLDGMRKAVAGLSLLKCTQRGYEIAEQYLEAEKEKRNSVERQVMEYLTKRKFREASLTVAAYEAEDGFPSGMGIERNPEQDMEQLKTIFESKPKILARLGTENFEALRIAAGMMAILGTTKVKEWLPANFETNLAFNKETAVRMLLFYAQNKSTLEGYHKGGVVKYIEILSAPDSCESCKKLNGKRFGLDEAPELPNEHCTNEIGCRCTFLAVLSDR